MKMLQENLRRTLQHRLPVFLYVAAVVALAVALIYFGWMRTWSSVYVPTAYPPFADMRVIQGAISSVEHGYDLDYPMLWIAVGKALNFSSESWFIAECAALVLCFVGLCAFLLFCYPSFGLLASLISTSTLLGIERGNTDLVVFCLVFLAATWIPKRWSPLPLLLATLLKLYPVYALTGMFIKRQFTLFAASLAGAVAIFAYLWDQLADIHSRIPVRCWLSYGLLSIYNCFIEQGLPPFQQGLPPWELWALFAALGFAILTLTYYFSKSDAATLKDDAAFDLLLVGAPIYVGTFMFASNFDYRLIFLILCIPFLQRRPFPFARTLIVVMLIAMNEMLVRAWLPAPWVVMQLAKSAIFVVLSAYLLALVWAALASLDAKRKLIAVNGTAELTPIEPPSP
jgi:hypothetical protein